MSEDKKYKVVNIMYWDEEMQESNVAFTSLTDKFTKEVCENSEYYPDSNMYIGKPRYFECTLSSIKNGLHTPNNIDYFVEENPELIDEIFMIDNPDYEWTSFTTDISIEYKPTKVIRDVKIESILK